MKIVIAAGAIVIIALSILYFTLEPAPAVAPAPEALPSEPVTTPEPSDVDETGRMANPDSEPNAPTGKLKVGNFTGTLEEVNTGCFSDGECYVTVDGKHITVLMGWSRTTVGSVLGVDSIGDLEGKIGSTIEVYAQDKSDGTYTLYGSEGFYVKVIGGKPTTPTPPVAGGSCVVGGCSSQLCVDASDAPMASTCEYREVYACYQTAECKRQTTGECGWTQTSELKACIAEKQ